RNRSREYTQTQTSVDDGAKTYNLPAQPITAKPWHNVDMDHIHIENWLDCIHAGRRDTHCTAEHGYQHAVACIMADRALHTGRRMLFDPKSRTIQEGLGSSDQ